MGMFRGVHRLLVPAAGLLFAAGVCAQPSASPGGAAFAYVNPAAHSVSLVGDFNGWSKDEHPLQRDSSGTWTGTQALRAGMFQYLFLVDGADYVVDPANPATTPNYNNSGRNSVFVLTAGGEVLLTSTPPGVPSNVGDAYPADSGVAPVYLNIIWHQHQPLYVNPETDQLQGPWVRTHATKDYYDMAAILRQYPDIHCNINLTSSLLFQLREYYVHRIAPFVDGKRNRVDTEAFWKRWKGKTDPWIDLALKPTADFSADDRAFLYENTWNAFGISEVQIDRFPEYLALKKKWEKGRAEGEVKFSEQELREIKFWFYLAHFDPDFLAGPVTLTDGTVCDLSGYVAIGGDGKYRLQKSITEEDCNRMVAEAVKVAANVIPVHRSLLYNPEKNRGQVEVITTPYYHPILPLIYDSDLAEVCQPGDPLPQRFAYPRDAEAQVAKAVVMYKEIFGVAPTGMWPGEGSVAQPVLQILRSNGILWTASDVKVLAHSRPTGRPNTTPYRFPASADTTNEGGSAMALVFRDTELSDRIGFKYQNYEGEDAAEDFVQSILRLAPRMGDPDALITVILDGENAWEWYRHDNDGKKFQHAFYRKLSRLFAQRRIVTTTTTEYIAGNPGRGIKAHPLEKLPRMNWLWPGSWINGNYDTWIGEPEENRAWEYLLRARQDLASTGLRQPDPRKPAPAMGSKAWFTYRAWEEMYAAEGSDWFWWYGADQSAPAGDEPFDAAFRIHLENIYTFARRAGSRIASPGFDPIIRKGVPAEGGQGAMAKSRTDLQDVLFVCDARQEKVPVAIYIAGNVPGLGEWTPNQVRMVDDGTNGDAVAGDGIWSFRLSLPIGEELQYKYTNSGEKGQWVPGEEFVQRNRSVVVTKTPEPVLIVNDVFGK
jgi:alpha-amylase/alpha-mannosidase (GH57 family)